MNFFLNFMHYKMISVFDYEVTKWVVFQNTHENRLKFQLLGQFNG